ncbi:hypothetical protein GZL_07977 [Streptomyces sp. 769]|nr:hypothetical protein GZL_07977 [Streptomyces sp. 769]
MPHLAFPRLCAHRYVVVALPCPALPCPGRRLCSQSSGLRLWTGWVVPTGPDGGRRARLADAPPPFVVGTSNAKWCTSLETASQLWALRGLPGEQRRNPGDLGAAVVPRPPATRRDGSWKP